MVELLSKNVFNPDILLEDRETPLVVAFVGVNGTEKQQVLQELLIGLRKMGRV